MSDALDLALERAGAVSVGRRPELKGRIDHAARKGRLTRLLPGTYCRGSDLHHRLAAVAQWDPDAVLQGAAAARVGWWSDLPVGEVELLTRRNVRGDWPGFRIRQGRFPEDLIWEHEGFRLASPAASVIQMLSSMGPGAIDESLRRGVTSIASLRWTLEQLPYRIGNVAAARWIEDSRDEPWSHLEREAHRLLRASGIRNWRANYPVSLPGGAAFLDVALLGVRIALEFDGWEFHRSRERFVGDRWRDVELQLAGWSVLRFTAETIERMPGVVLQMVRRRG